MKNYDCNSVESSYIMYFDTNNLYGWAMSLKLYGFEWEENIHKFNENFIKRL